MEHTRLGNTGIEISRVGIGTLQSSRWAFKDDRGFAHAVGRALDLGVNWLDTAPAYGDGLAEELVGRVLQSRRQHAVIATKFNFTDSRPADVRASLERSLKRLRTDYVDLFQQHWPSPDVPVEETIGALERLKAEGKIRAIGVSNWMEPEWDELDHPRRIDGLQACHSLLWRSIESHVLPLCQKYGVAVLAYSPLCQGILAGRFRSEADLSSIARDSRRANRRLQPDTLAGLLAIVCVLTDVGTNYEKTPAQTALRWLLDQRGIASVIVGSSSVEQMEENIGALGWELESSDWQKLSEVTLSISADLGPTDTLWGWHPKIVRIAP